MHSGVAGIDLTEGFEGKLDFRCRHSQSGIAHFERHPAILGVAGGDRDRSAGLSELDRVRQ